MHELSCSKNLGKSDQFILGMNFFRIFDVTIDLNNALFRIRNQEKNYAAKRVNLRMTQECKGPVFSTSRARLKLNEAAKVSLRMKN